MKDAIMTAALVTNGRPLLEPSITQQLNDFYKRNEGKTIYIMVSTRKPPRSVEFNNYYWKCLEIISDSSGDTSEELHDDFKEALLPRTFDENGKELRKSTAGLNTSQFYKYMEGVKRLAAEHKNVVLPDPPPRK